jgi:Fe-S-cluster-containing hydrogenase component 2
MRQARKIIEIDEARCNGCGQCIVACAEGALKLVDGKAKLVGEILCDGWERASVNAQGALTIVEREAEASTRRR